MATAKIHQMCDRVQAMAAELNELTDNGHARTAYAILLRMKLAAATVELVEADLMRRLGCG